MYNFFFILLMSYAAFFLSGCGTNNTPTETNQETSQVVVKPVGNVETVQVKEEVKVADKQAFVDDKKKKAAPNKKMDKSKLNPLLKTQAHQLATRMATKACICYSTNKGLTPAYTECLEKAKAKNKVEETMAGFSSKEKELYNKVLTGITDKCFIDRK